MIIILVGREEVFSSSQRVSRNGGRWVSKRASSALKSFHSPSGTLSCTLQHFFCMGRSP